MENASRDELVQRRARAVRTAWMLAAVAVLIFIGFILSGVLKA
jgi:hypothetical protein